MREQERGSPPSPPLTDESVLERNVVVVRFSRRGILGWSGASRACAGARSFFAFIRSTSSRTAARADQLHPFRYDAELAALLAGLLVFPCVELEPALNENRATFL